MEIWDAHTHIGRPYIDEIQPDKLEYQHDTCELLIEDMKRNYVTRSLIFPTASVQYEVCNEDISKSVKRFPDYFIGFARVNPRLGTLCLDQVKRAAKELGLKGLKLHPDIESFRPDHNIYKPLFELLIELDFVVLIHSDPSSRTHLYSSPFYIERVAQNYPKLKIIMAHLNEDSLIVMERTPNIYSDTAIIPHIPTIQHAIDLGFENRICFGSDWPYGNGTKFEIWKIKEAVQEDNIREKVFAKNLKHLFK